LSPDAAGYLARIARYQFADADRDEFFKHACDALRPIREISATGHSARCSRRAGQARALMLLRGDLLALWRCMRVAALLLSGRPQLLRY
jgi:hypothetical protein